MLTAEVPDSWPRRHGPLGEDRWFVERGHFTLDNFTWAVSIYRVPTGPTRAECLFVAVSAGKTPDAPPVLWAVAPTLEALTKQLP